MQQLNDTTAKTTILSNTDVASGGDCVISIAAVTGERHTIDWVAGGYYANPDANTAIVIKDTTANTVLGQCPITRSGPIFFPFYGGFQCPVGNAVSVTLEDGSQIKDLFLQYR